VVDNGVGFAHDPDGRETLGLNLVRSLVDQIGGQLAICSDRGTSVEVRLARD
jgi:two-component sensor histidine kinase